MEQGVAVSLGLGAALGLSAGLSPGPLLALVLSQTLAHGVREGVKVAFVPLITDAPVILVSLLLLSRFSGSHLVLGLISVAGGCYLLRLGYLNFLAPPRAGGLLRADPQSLRKGVVVNLLSPNPYLFWMTVGAPVMLRGWEERPVAAFAFAVSFYVCLVGVQVAVATSAGHAGRWLTGRGYRCLMCGLGALLAIFGFVLIREGLTLLGVLRG